MRARSERGERRPGARGRLWRLFGGATLIALLTTVAVSTAAIETVGHIADLLATGGFINSKYLKPTSGGSPTTILILGTDRRATTAVDHANPAHSDTILLVHLDPGKGTTTEMSIPRDLVTPFTYNGALYSASKINYAYTLGGPNLSTHVIEDLLHIQINYAIDLNFHSFDEVVDKLGCVFVDVDHEYLNTAAEAVYDNYATIDVKPGYQQLCGQRALDYVRYRHLDSTFARDAREQAFLRDAKAQLGVSGLLNHGTDIINALAKSINSNIRGSATVAGLLETVASSVAGPVRQVKFPNNPVNIGGAADETVSPAEVTSLRAQFLGETPVRLVLPSAGGGVSTPSTHHHHRRAGSPVATPTAPGLYPTPASVQSSAVSLSVDVPFPVYLPTLSLDTAQPDQFNPFYAYTVKDQSGKVHHGYRIDWATGMNGSYYGIEGMDWTNPPLFANADSTTRFGRRYLFVTNGSTVQDVGWIVGSELYWISNTVLDDLTARQMFALAESAGAV